MAETVMGLASDAAQIGTFIATVSQSKLFETRPEIIQQCFERRKAMLEYFLKYIPHFMHSQESIEQYTRLLVTLEQHTTALFALYDAYPRYKKKQISSPSSTNTASTPAPPSTPAPSASTSASPTNTTPTLSPSSTPASSSTPAPSLTPTLSSSAKPKTDIWLKRMIQKKVEAYQGVGEARRIRKDFDELEHNVMRLSCSTFCQNLMARLSTGVQALVELERDIASAKEDLLNRETSLNFHSRLMSVVEELSEKRLSKETAQNFIAHNRERLEKEPDDPFKDANFVNQRVHAASSP